MLYQFPDLSTSGSFGYNSLTSQVISSSYNVKQFPAGSNNNLYCYLQSTDSNSLQGLDFAYYLANGQCQNGQVICSTAGVLSLYPQPSDASSALCSGTPEVWPLTANVSPVTSTIFKNFTGSIVRITGASETFVWVTIVPQTIFVPKFQIPMEIIETIGFVAAVLLMLPVVGYYIYKYYQSRSTVMLRYAVSSMIWFVWIMLSFYLAYAIVTNEQLLIFDESIATTFNIATLATVVNSLSILLIVFGEQYKFMLYTVTFLVHIGLGGGSYFSYLFYFPNHPVEFDMWKLAAPIWVIFVIVVNTLTPLCLVSSSIKRVDSQFFQKFSLISIKRTIQQYRRLCVLLLLQFINTVAFFIASSIQNYTNLPGSDRNYYAIQGISTFIFTFHAGLNIFILEEAKRVMLKGHSNGFAQS